MKNVIYFILVSLLVFTSCKKESNPISTTEDASNPTSPDTSPTITYSGKVYHTVKIGSQTWMKENLDVGAMIDSLQNPSNNGTIEKYCYGNDTANCNKYGGLYQWDEAMDYSTTNGAKGICPTGWHIPTRAEFDTLAAAVHNNSNSLKAVGQGASQLGGAGTNTSGFSALLAGFRWHDGHFDYLEAASTFWSSTEFNAPYADYLSLAHYGSSIFLSYSNREFGNSIRCIKDE